MRKFQFHSIASPPLLREFALNLLPPDSCSETLSFRIHVILLHFFLIIYLLMYFRKDRVKLHGKTNFEYKSQGPFRPED